MIRDSVLAALGQPMLAQQVPLCGGATICQQITHPSYHSANYLTNPNYHRGGCGGSCEGQLLDAVARGARGCTSARGSPKAPAGVVGRLREVWSVVDRVGTPARLAAECLDFGAFAALQHWSVRCRSSHGGAEAMGGRAQRTRAGARRARGRCSVSSSTRSEGSGEAR